MRVPIRTYGREDSDVRLLWTHGGGFFTGDLDMPEAHLVSTELAARADAFVVSVDYRLAGDGVRYPAPLDDVHDEWKALCAERSDARVAIGGASAGAALALATALRTRDGDGRLPDALLLVYPFCHFPNPALDEETRAVMATMPELGRQTPAAVEDMVRTYVGRITDLPPYAMPGAARLSGLPATGILLSEFDDLRPSGELLHRQLADERVPVTSHLVRGVPHGHLNLGADFRGFDESLDFLARLLRSR
ncbi:alpha/beta hydrolase fold domain-containing protein [Virgisporangium aliadipatigenens]|uniref:alpha/beta hydrolase fold domain-containing protein n=1 Tax=Virgisporangium aliadipatigenens TaxID=741659 RepID=UPI001943DCE6|nr:alpha/beta hydrolase fold domain-containing protein [Virgisporangium aliadipatigenens]